VESTAWLDTLGDRMRQASGVSGRTVVIDTDPGVDDAMAILLALACPELEVVGLTAVFGNAATAVTARNALVVLDAAGRADIPVAAGEVAPVASPYLGPATEVHGADGLGGAVAGEPAPTLVGTAAHELIATAAAGAPGEVTLLALGPLTNIAGALHHHPELADLVAEVVIMGGNALVPGNITPAAEANACHDPEAADLVLGASWPVTMVGLDVTHQVNLTGERIDRITGAPTPGCALLRRALPHYRAFFETRNGIDGIYLHDPTAVAYLVDPGAFTTSRWPVRVETESFSRGKTWPNLGGTDDAAPAAWQGRPAVNVCTGVDAARVLDLVEQRLTSG
jgi:inosine-uridine nucleoside N-ribohydrolase